MKWQNYKNGVHLIVETGKPRVFIVKYDGSLSYYLLDSCPSDREGNVRELLLKYYEALEQQADRYPLY